MKKEELKKKLKIVKFSFSILFSFVFMVLTKVKISPIFGTESKFSASIFLGPTLQRLFGVKLGMFSILLAEIFGFIVGYYKLKNLLSVLMFVPILGAGFYFANLFHGKKKIAIIPALSIFLFILHPIGRKVWYYSLFWSIPIIIALKNFEKKKFFGWKFLVLYGYSLATVFTDHAIGSILYLYYYNIPEKFWIQAIPFTIIERLIMALGLEITYLLSRYLIKTMEELLIAIYKIKAYKIMEKVDEKIRIKENEIIFK